MSAHQDIIYRVLGYQSLLGSTAQYVTALRILTQLLLWIAHRPHHLPGQPTEDYVEAVPATVVLSGEQVRTA